MKKIRVDKYEVSLPDNATIPRAIRTYIYIYISICRRQYRSYQIYFFFFFKTTTLTWIISLSFNVSCKNYFIEFQLSRSSEFDAHVP